MAERAVIRRQKWLSQNKDNDGIAEILEKGIDQPVWGMREEDRFDDKLMGSSHFITAYKRSPFARTGSLQEMNIPRLT